MEKQCIIDWFFLLFKRRVVCTALCLLSFSALFSQKYLNDTLWFGATSNCILTMALPTDSGIYVAGAKADIATGVRVYPVIGFVDSLGNSSVIHESYDVNSNQIIYGSYYKLFLNTEGNFVLAYANVENFQEYPRVKEITPQGQLVRDLKLDTIYDLGSSGYAVLDGTCLYQHKDSSYWLWSITSEDFSDPVNSRHVGPLLTILKSDFSVDTIRRYYFDPFKKWDYYFTDEVELDSGKTAVMVQNTFYPPGGPIENAVGVISLLILNEKGNILNSYTYTDNSLQGSGATSMIKSLDGNNLIVLHNEENRHGDSTTLLVYVSKFSYSLQLKSQTLVNTTDILTVGGVLFFGSKRVIATSDSNYLSLCTGFPLERTNQTAERICKVSPAGEILWQRDFYFLENTDTSTFGDFLHDMTDVRECPDGGFAFPGQVNGITPVSFQVGWLVKTNCLGFLGPPEAAVSWQKNATDNTVQFFNNSLQAGTYHWDFGDGFTFDVDETMDTLFHNYQDTGTYQAQLIAYGCNGDLDTLRFDVNVYPTIDSVYQEGEGYFTFYPNPIASGNILYVYLNGMNEAKGSAIDLTFYDYSGNLVRTVSLSSKEGNYMIPNQFSSGMYFVHLTQNGENIAVKKLVVN